MVNVKIGAMIIPAVRESGCVQRMLKASLVSLYFSTEDSPVSMHGESYAYLRRCLSLSSLGWTKELPMGIAQKSPWPMLLGQDWKYFHEVLDQAMGQS